jgi:hypothetical protein
MQAPVDTSLLRKIVDNAEWADVKSCFRCFPFKLKGGARYVQCNARPKIRCDVEDLTLHHEAVANKRAESCPYYELEGLE